MYIAPCDREILWSNEMRQLKEEYYRRFGKQYPHFNYTEFHSIGEKCAAQVYWESLKKILNR